jgi:hypothetical protein
MTQGQEGCPRRLHIKGAARDTEAQWPGMREMEDVVSMCEEYSKHSILRMIVSS